MAELNRTRAAQILCDAAYLGDEKAAEKWKVTSKTVRNYRDRLKTDTQLSSLFQNLRRELEGNWKAETSRTLRVGLRKIAQMVEAIDTFAPSPEMLEALTGAVKAVAEIAITTEVLNAGDAGSSQNSTEKGRAMA